MGREKEDESKDKDIEEYPKKQDAGEESGHRDKEDIQKWNFFTHLIKRLQRGQFHFLKGGLSSLRKEYTEYKDLKESTWQKYETYEVVLAGATDTVEYYILLVLSCLITVFGLYGNSAATIIGAMIVAPLMGPILGFSVAVLWGRGRDIWEATTTLLKGTIIVVGITSLITYLMPYISLGEQIIIRTQPGLLDIGIALASGLVGSYAYVNKKITNSLPGVAISVALMPPLCTVGIGIGLQDWQIAQGAATLFAINLLGISLAALVMFSLVKLHPHVIVDLEDAVKMQTRVIGQILLTIVLLTSLSTPMVLLSLKAIKLNQERQVILQILESCLGDLGSLETEIYEEKGIWNLRVLLYQKNSPPFDFQEVSGEVEEKIQDKLSKSVKLRLYNFQPLNYP